MTGLRGTGGDYDCNWPAPSYGGYEASRYLRDDPRYREHRLKKRERIYRGSDDRNYCRRSDGTIRLVVGAIVGYILGNIIARGDSKTLDTILGAGAGAMIRPGKRPRRRPLPLVRLVHMASERTLTTLTDGQQAIARNASYAQWR